MIAARPVQDLTRGLGRNAFDLPVSALAGFAAAVVAFAIPADLLGQLVSATGLPHLLAAAEPPLGLKARAGIGIAGAGAAFGLVFLLMRMLDRRGRARPAVREPEGEHAPRLRRRDVHPDAPVCRPISAARDFGEPAPPAPRAQPEPSAPPAPAPLELTERTPAWFVDEEAEPDDALAEAFAPDLDTVRAALWDEPGIAPEPAPASESEPEAEPAGYEPEPVPVYAAEPEPAPACEPEPEPELRPEPLAEATLPDLMRRLEQGLARRRDRRAFATPPAHAPAPQVFPEANDDRLQSAIESLQRFAARGD